MQVPVGSSERSLIREIGCIDDQSLALPMAPRVPQPLPDVLWKMWTPVKWDDANVVNHLDEYDHVTGNLQNLIIIVVRAGKHGRPGGGPQDTTFCQAPVLRAASGTP